MYVSCLTAIVPVLLFFSFSPCTVRGEENDAERLNLIAPAKQGELLLRPTFCSCSVYWGAPEHQRLSLEFRKSGAAAWFPALTPGYYKETHQYSGSIMNLTENTDYEVQFRSGKNVLASGKFRTWSDTVPVAKTIVFDPAKFQKKLVISDRGTPEGWIRYTMSPGSVIDFPCSSCVIEINCAACVLLEGLTIKGGTGSHVIRIENSHHVRISNCDISRWGRVGIPRYDHSGLRFPGGKAGRDREIDYDGAILIGEESSSVVVERCYIHDPRGQANSWYYSHPAGPEAVLLRSPDHSTVLRYNDFIGSDLHRWNDAVEGCGNFCSNGGFNRDADIYGNFMIFCNDDAIELDGGQQNVRCFRNRFESAYCGVSIQGCMAGPSYVFGNLFSGMCEEHGSAGQTIKTGGGSHGREARSLIFNNTLWGPGSGILLMPTLKCDLRNNLFCGQQSIHQTGKDSPVFSANSVSVPEQAFRSVDSGDFSLSSPRPGIRIPNFFDTVPQQGAVQPGKNTQLPFRPLPVFLSRSRIAGVKVAGGTVSPRQVKLTAIVPPEADYAGEFRVAQNQDFDWFTVTPSRGFLRAGSPTEFTVTFDGKKMRDRRHYRGAFLIRFRNGLSRPVSVYAETDFVPPLKPVPAGKSTIYLNAFHPVSGIPAIRQDSGSPFGSFLCLKEGQQEELRYRFRLPRAGRYYVLIHGRGVYPRVMAAVDDEKMAESRQQTVQDHPYWTIIAPGSDFGCKIRCYDLKPGEHTLRLRSSRNTLFFDSLAITDDPGAFEPR